MHPHAVAHVVRHEIAPRAYTEGPWQWGQVAAIHASPNTVDLHLDGNTTTAVLGVRYLAAYTPAVGDVVLVGRYGSDRYCFGKLA